MRKGRREGGKEGEEEEEEEFKVKWDEFLGVDRGKAQSKAAAKATHVQEDEDGREGGNEEVSAAVVAGADELKPVIAGPWMLRWEMTHHNAHTAGLEEVEAVPAKWRKA
jgi:hypothetical protein